VERFHAEAASLLDGAREEARRRRHSLVQPAHVVAAACTAPPARSALVDRAFDVDALWGTIDRHLTTLPEAGGYRDGAAAVAFSSSLESAFLVARLELLAPTNRLGVTDILRAVLADRTIAALVLEITTWNDSTSGVLTRAAALAAVETHSVLEPEHLLRIFLGDPSFAGAIVRAGGDVRRVEKEVDAQLAGMRGMMRALRSPARSQAVEDLLAHAEHAAAHSRPAITERASLAVRVVEAQASVLENAGVDPNDVIQVLVHGTLPEEARTPDGALLDVVFHNDAVTTQILVSEILRSDFGMASDEALRVMETIHAGDTLVVGTYPAPRARAMRTAALQRARLHRSPLRITLRER
jgi:ATP-dependent Clp protease adapter protein ClpS